MQKRSYVTLYSFSCILSLVLLMLFPNGLTFLLGTIGSTVLLGLLVYQVLNDAPVTGNYPMQDDDLPASGD